jgi:hypothetical protein
MTKYKNDWFNQSFHVLRIQLIATAEMTGE